MARGSSKANSEFPGSASERGFASPGEKNATPDAGRIQLEYGMYGGMNQRQGMTVNSKEHRKYARGVLADAFASSEWSELGMPDSRYAMDALDAMQKMSQKWTESGMMPSLNEAKEFRDIAVQAVKSMDDEMNQEARALRMEYLRERDNGMGGSRAQSELASQPTQPDGSPTKFPKMRESLKLLSAGSPTVQGIKDTKDYAFSVLNSYVSRAAFGIDIDDLPDSNKVWDKVRSMQATLDRFIKKPETATDEAFEKFKSGAKAAGKRIANLAMRDEL